ncbi:MAG: 5-methylcytosine restriction system specificity protein McrC [Adhaeribacter sp.]
MPIPVQNIYYLLSYAWDLPLEKEEETATAAPGDKVLNLLASLLYRNLLRLLRQGLAQGYVQKTEVLSGIKGKIAVMATLQKDLFREGKAICTYETLSSDILPNQLIKATLAQLFKTPSFAPELQRSLQSVYRYFEEVSLIQPKEADFKKLPTTYGLNKYYGRVLPLCQFIRQNLLPEKGSSNFYLANFLEDEQQMGRLFEYFVRNFYRQEQQIFQVKSEKINWQIDAVEVDDLDYLPQMKTDISLLSEARKIIIDTKFYQQALVQRYDKQKLISAHLYQLFAYLKNHPESTPELPIEGMLLYPVVEQELSLNYQLHGHKISINTINLAQPWPQIKEDLLGLIS